MERNTQTILENLKPGDRFYFAGDRKKIVYTLNTMHPFEWKVQKGFRLQYANCRMDNADAGGLQVEQFRANRRVIFLRNINT